MTHGHTVGGKRSPTFVTWSSMRQRCSSSKHSSYSRYGGRGIKVCERWLSFANFLADMGDRPAGKTLDRVNNEGDYCPENCAWTTPREQMRNRRGTKLDETSVMQIRWLVLEGGHSQGAVAKAFEISQPIVSRILSGESWVGAGV